MKIRNLVCGRPGRPNHAQISQTQKHVSNKQGKQNSGVLSMGDIDFLSFGAMIMKFMLMTFSDEFQKSNPGDKAIKMESVVAVCSGNRITAEAFAKHYQSLLTAYNSEPNKQTQWIQLIS